MQKTERVQANHNCLLCATACKSVSTPTPHGWDAISRRSWLEYGGNTSRTRLHACTVTHEKVQYNFNML